MKCPNDNSILILKTQENAYAYCCNQCNGVFLNSKQVSAFKNNFETDFLERAFASSKMIEINGVCDCKQKIHSATVDGITIDLCKNCKNVFFQKGQLTQIKEKYIGITHQEDFYNNFLPWPLLAIRSVYKLFVTNSDSKSRPFYKWLLIFTFTFFILWLVLD